MKKFLLSVSLLGGLLVGCSSDDNANSKIDDDGVEVIGGVTQPNKIIKVIDRVELTTIDEREGEKVVTESILTFNYKDNKLSSLVSSTEGPILDIFYNEKGELYNVVFYSPVEEDEPSNLVVSEITKYLNVGKIGRVTKIDNGNPTELAFYSFNDNGKVRGEYDVTIEYDKMPYFAFHTLNTTGVIELSKKTQLDFGLITPAVITGQEYANKLLPMNNPTSLDFNSYNGKDYNKLTTEYTYTPDNYIDTFNCTSEEFSDEYDIHEFMYSNGKVFYKELK